MPVRLTVVLLAAALWCGSAAGATQHIWMQTSDCAVKGDPSAPPVWAQHPATIGLSCNGIAHVTAVRWRHWGSAVARATGTLVLETCNPSCATGPTHRYPTTIVASHIKVCGTRHVYGTITLHWTDAGHSRTSHGPLQGCF